MDIAVFLFLWWYYFFPENFGRHLAEVMNAFGKVIK